MIATATLRDRVRIDRYTGTSGEGAPAFSTPLLNVPARMYEDTRQNRTGEGTDRVTVQKCTLRPGLGVVEQSLVTLNGEAWEVSSIEHARELGRPHHDDLVLDGPREPTVSVPELPVTPDVTLDGGAP